MQNQHFGTPTRALIWNIRQQGTRLLGFPKILLVISLMGSAVSAQVITGNVRDLSSGDPVYGAIFIWLRTIGQ